MFCNLMFSAQLRQFSSNCLTILPICLTNYDDGIKKDNLSALIILF